MKNVSISGFILALSFLLFSCQSIDKPLGKIRLNENQLSEILMDMEEYQAYVFAYQELQRKLAQRASNMSSEDEAWLQSIHAKYEQHDDFLRLSKEEEIARYNKLTGIDLINDQSDLARHFGALKEKLDDRYLYDRGHFVNLLSPENL